MEKKKFLKKNAHMIIQSSNYNAANKIFGIFFLLHVYIPISVGLIDSRVKNRYFLHILESTEILVNQY